MDKDNQVIEPVSLLKQIATTMHLSQEDEKEIISQYQLLASKELGAQILAHLQSSSKFEGLKPLFPKTWDGNQADLIQASQKILNVLYTEVPAQERETMKGSASITALLLVIDVIMGKCTKNENSAVLKLIQDTPGLKIILDHLQSSGT